VFDPLAVMLVIAANQTLLRYGINLEKKGPEEDSNGNSTSDISINDDGQQTDNSEGSGDSQGSEPGASNADDSLPVQREGADDNKLSKNYESSSIAKKAEAALQRKIKKLEKQLTKKPKEVIIDNTKELDINLTVPKSILNLEKKLSKRLSKDDD
jgi:hypothetical protein